MYTPDECIAVPSSFGPARDARPVRLVVGAPGPVSRAERDDVRDVPEGVDDVMFGLSVAALLLSPVALVASALLA